MYEVTGFDMFFEMVPYEDRDEVSDDDRKILLEKSYEYGLPEYLQNDLDAFKEGLKTGSTLMDCLAGELYGSINSAEIDDCAITSEHADYLRKKFLGLDAGR